MRRAFIIWRPRFVRAFQTSLRACLSRTSTFDWMKQQYDAIAAERLFARISRRRRSKRFRGWAVARAWGVAAATLVLIGFTGAWLAETLRLERVQTNEPDETVAQEVEILVPRTTKSDRLSGLASYFEEGDQ